MGSHEGGAPRPWENQDPFAAIPGPRVKIQGTIQASNSQALLDIDLFRSDPTGPGGRAFVGKIKRTPGAFEIQVPASFGEVRIDVFQDLASDGPSPGDPFAACPCNPVNLSKGDVKGIVIVMPGG
jgi:hypothetical protein